MRSVLVGGIGNVFFGDDGFGVEVARVLASKARSAEVRVIDFGVRGFDLACALVDGYDAVILVDATRGSGPPGTLYVIEPEVTEALATNDGHSLDPRAVLALARTMSERVAPVRLVGCEPLSLGDEDEGAMGLSACVAAAVPEAVAIVERLIEEALDA